MRPSTSSDLSKNPGSVRGLPQQMNLYAATIRYNDVLMHNEGPKAEADAKTLGAYYTDAQVADFLVRWAVREKHEKILDPSFGGGVFLRSASKRLADIGGSPIQVFGIELDQNVHSRVAEKLADEFDVPPCNLRHADFFTEPSSGVEVVVGNPPFIRYQRFAGDARKRGIACAQQHGVRLSELSSSWLPFLLHSISHLSADGRLAMVIPVELTYAAYARPALDVLARTFRAVYLLTFRKKLFPDLSEDTLLLLAEGKGSGPAQFFLRDLAHASTLAEFTDRRPKGLLRLNPQKIASGEERVIEHQISRKARDLYRELKLNRLVSKLGDIADVGIGYVTGANDFFHLHPDAARMWQIPRRNLRCAVRRGRSLSGVRFTKADWKKSLSDGETAYLLYVRPTDVITDELSAYLRKGEASGVPRVYKCRVREPWYSVPHVYQPDAFLSYMSGATPRLVANDANAVAPNSLHIVRLSKTTTLDAEDLAAVWKTSLTRLSAEIEGHSLGGGMLKLEPTEAENVLIAVPQTLRKHGLPSELDEILRTGGDQTAVECADRAILHEDLGLSVADCELLRRAAESLRARRYDRATA